MVIGGGIIGTSIAYHLAEAGWSDTVLLERDQLTSGTTWHAAGLMVTFGSTSQTSTELRTYTKDLYQRLEAETGQATGCRPIGLMEVPADAGRLEEYRRVSAFNRHLGVDVHEISAREVGQLFPLARTDAERRQVNDPRLSLEERYGTHAGYVRAVADAARNLRSERLLLDRDVERYIDEAESSDVLR